MSGLFRRRVLLRENEIRPRYDVVVVGGGGHGLAIAYNLARRHGIRDVGVFERAYIGAGGSGRNTTVLRANYKTPETIPFYKASFDLYRTLSSEFQSEGSRAGGWAPLSPAYAARKAQEWPGRPILQRRRVLMRTLTVKGEPGQIRRLTTESMTLGTSHKAARFHQEGTRHMPARPPIALSRVDEERWLDLTREWVLRRAREAGLAT